MPACEGSWLLDPTFQAGNQASFQVLQKDKHENVVSLITGSYEVYPFDVSTIAYNNSMSKILDIEYGFQIFSFIPTIIGNFTLLVSSTSNSEHIKNGPFPFLVFPGRLHIKSHLSSFLSL